MGDVEKKGVECSSSRSSTIGSLKRCCLISGLGINDRFDDDEMLLQILCCLPLKSVVACKLVCKRWLSLISTQGFVSCFISRHTPHHHHQAYLVLRSGWRYFHLSSKLPNPGTSFSFLPTGSSNSTTYSRASTFEILASSEDLVLCSKTGEFDGTIRYFICNPITKGWVQLPPPPPSTSDHSFGFTCEPYYKVNNGHRESVVVNSSCRFRVVRFKLINGLVMEPPFMIEVDIFTSETWQWTTMMMHYPFGYQPTSSTSYNGLLYWVSYYRGGGGVVIHDPFNNKVCHAVYPPQDASSRSRFTFSVSSEGSLLALRWSISWDFKVWELEDLDQPKWRLKSAVAVRNHLLNTSEMFKRAWKSSLTPLGFDPNDKNVIFFWSSVGWVANINLMTRVFEASRLSQIECDFRNLVQVLQRTSTLNSPLSKIKAPCWPTPVSALRNQAPAEKKKPTD